MEAERQRGERAIQEALEREREVFEAQFAADLESRVSEVLLQ